MLTREVVTIERHILEEERQHPKATGAFSNILYDIALAAKIISREVRRAGIADILGETGTTNVHGEHVKKLDRYAHDTIYKSLAYSGHLCMMASEEEEDLLPIPDGYPLGSYILLFDPLDGSSNIESDAPIGTIFSLHRKVSDSPSCLAEDILQPGYRQVAAGYVLYGSSTMLVYTTGRGVHGFTLDPSIGEFLLSHPNLKIPAQPKRIYSVNEGNYTSWSLTQQRLVDTLKGIHKGKNGIPADPYTARYIGSLVADVHRTILYGGLFMYPKDIKNPKGKLRLLYEAAPLAAIVEQAGGEATDGERRILDIIPESLHARTPLFLGDATTMATTHEHLSAGSLINEATTRSEEQHLLRPRTPSQREGKGDLLMSLLSPL